MQSVKRNFKAEVWDAYDENFNLIEGKILTRGKKIPKGIFHLVCNVLAKHVDGTFLVMQRDYNKSNGGMWEASAGGSALLGEKPLDCARRELKEETGIIVSDLNEIGMTVCEETRSIYIEYVCKTNWPKENITLQKGETVNFEWVNKSKLVYMKNNGLLTYRKHIFRFIDLLH